MTQLTAQGLIRSRLDERLSQLQAAVKAIFGESVDLSPDSIDGQTLGIFAEALSNLDQLVEDVYHCIDPSSASGAALSRLVQLNSIRRIGGTYSTADVTCVGQEGTVIPAGSLIKATGTNATFATVAETVIGSSGQEIVSVKAIEMGPKMAPANTLTKIDTPVYGWQTVTNPQPAIPGRDEETDEALRIRRKASTATAGVAMVDSIYGALANLPGVLQVEVYENEENVADANGLPPHSINCVVEGGTLTEIAQAIWRKKGSGVTMVGAVSQTTNDSRGNPHAIKFDRPAYSDVWLTVDVTKKPGWPTTGEQQIKDNIVKWGLVNQKIGKEVQRTRIFDPINDVPGHFAENLKIGLTLGTVAQANIAVPFNGLARFDQSRIVVNFL